MPAGSVALFAIIYLDYPCLKPTNKLPLINEMKDIKTNNDMSSISKSNDECNVIDAVQWITKENASVIDNNNEVTVSENIVGDTASAISMEEMDHRLNKSRFHCFWY